MRSILHQPDNKEMLHSNVLIIYFLGHAQNLSNGNDHTITRFVSETLILKFNSFWLYEVLFPSCQLKCWEAMFCCLFITHFLNRLCSNPTPLLFLFLDAKAQTSFFADSIYFFPTSISPDIKDKAHFPRWENFFHPTLWGVLANVIKDSVDSGCSSKAFVDLQSSAFIASYSLLSAHHLPSNSKSFRLHFPSLAYCSYFTTGCPKKCLTSNWFWR